jgi:hypothetical protein
MISDAFTRNGVEELRPRPGIVGRCVRAVLWFLPGDNA